MKSSTPENIGSYFDELSAQFINNYEQTGLKKQTDFILDYFTHISLKDKHFLELGCGIGGLLFKFLELGAKKVTGIDLSHSMIGKAQELASYYNYENKSTFFRSNFDEDFPSLTIEHPNVIIADRMFCCSGVAGSILLNMVNLNPDYIVIVLPRKNPVYRKFCIWKNKIRRIKFNVKSDITIHYWPVSEITNVCNDHNYDLVDHHFRYVWETLIYKKND